MRHGFKTAVVVLAGMLLPCLGTGTAQAAGQAFTCVSTNVNTCVVTIPLTSDLNERVTSTMPDTHPWFMGEANGNGVHAPYSITGPGNDDTTWDGVGGATQGSVWSAILTTGDDEPAGGAAVLTFDHVNSITGPTKPYKSISVTAPAHVKHGATLTVTAVVKPMPAAGHVDLQVKSTGGWVTVDTMVLSGTPKHWVGHLKWTFPAHAVLTLRVLATAAPGLKATPSHAFKVATAS